MTETQEHPVLAIELRINGTPCHVVTALRLTHPPQKVNAYALELATFGPLDVSIDARGEIEHRYADGLLALSQAVLAWATKAQAEANAEHEAAGGAVIEVDR